jgi:hypothetical protein
MCLRLHYTKETISMPTITTVSLYAYMLFLKLTSIATLCSTHIQMLVLSNLQIVQIKDSNKYGFK